MTNLPSTTIDTHLKAALSTWPTWEAPFKEAPSLIEKLSGGLSHHSYRISDGQQLRVLRLENPESRSLAFGRQQEISAQQLAASHHLAAHIYFIGDHFLVTDYLIGSHWPAAPSTQQLQWLGRALKQLHQLPIDNLDEYSGAIKPFDMATHIEAYWQKLTQAPPPLQALRPLAERLVTQLAQIFSPPVLCHHDLHPSNILINDHSIKFLDWEYAAINDRYFDLASLMEYCLPDSKAFKGFNTAYGLDNIDWPRLTLQRFLVRYLECLWLLIQAQPAAYPAAFTRLETLSRAVETFISDT
jgi:thiamine kinase-like enzyme